MIKYINDYFFPGDMGITDETEKFIDESDFLQKLYNFLIDEGYAEEDEIIQNCNNETDYGASVGDYLVYEDSDVIEEIYKQFIKIYD